MSRLYAFNVSYINILPRDAMLTRYMMSSCVRPSVRQSVTSRSSTKTAKPRFKQESPLVFWRKNCGEIAMSSTLKKGPDKVGRLKSAIFDQYLAISQKRCKIMIQLLWKTKEAFSLRQYMAIYCHRRPYIVIYRRPRRYIAAVRTLLNRNSYALHWMSLFQWPWVTPSNHKPPNFPHFVSPLISL